MKNKVIIALFLVIVSLSIQSVSCRKSSPVPVQDSGLGLLIKKSITEWTTPSKAVVGGERMYSAVLIESFYKGRKYRPAWYQDGHLMQTETLIKAIEEAYGDGLTPDYYHLQIIRSLVKAVKKESFSDASRLADLDILLTDTFITLGCHLSGGCVNPVTIETEWFARRRTVDVSAVLEQALKNKQIRDSLERLRPKQDAYYRLRQALARYRELLSKGEWPLISNGPLLKKGIMSDRVLDLRKRLAASGDLEPDAARGGVLFDEKLMKSVISVQKRHGLKAAGIVDSATLNALNIPLKERVRQMELNMERLRWILGNREQSSIVVNIANFQLDVIENGKSIISMKVVVGKPYWDTPVFTAKMTCLIINPSWNIPDSIARKELVKKIKNNPHYLAEQKIKVLRGWGSSEEEIDPETIAWATITANNLPYRFRQEPGPLNPLGRLKFMLPNKFDVYLHDTPAKRLFSENVRAFSHGCTRIEKPVELAEYLLRYAPLWTREKLLAAIAEGTEQTVLIPHPVNVDFLYLTAWVDEGGAVQFRNDIYGRDKRLDEALHKQPSLQ
ncbi:MAG: L,D-transpeptidase family protein [Dissulfurispiraceae bacterium]